MMDDILTYEKFKEEYPNSKITENDYKALYKVSRDYILSRIVYSYDILSEENKKDIQFYILYQINYFGENELEKSGVVSQSINGTSLSFNSDNKQGDLNIAGIVNNWLKRSPLGVRRL